jgi:phosphoribosylformimino-5-aminoimidazole carboxamide ribonucleotide (ProFAR) isomerase
MEKTDKPVIASGGISTLEDISALRQLVPLGLEGAILGKALYAKRFSLEQALELAGK